ncbi:DUF3604 domain-containing protein [Candidatus Marimicrobium litorale]|uniref:DUF3604 domain-containing protein n=1 Tax=Candidatus Marimicrobium litorale TaxID=2518991 RepID=A0ABT3T6Z4_9GAMM|nr:DUF3604 domain-containing protein [Candidatus Marimicrobium litorale]MCX2978040.1 DUF3604 domain-containing protein [Candidatus Marimicrobium litorale]
MALSHKDIVFTLPLLMLACSPVEDPSLYPQFNAETAVKPQAKAPTAYNPQRNLYWGDLHIHTSYSTDAYTNGVRATPDDAYTFVKGGEIEHAAGYGIRMARPLDFAAVTDHSEYLGVLQATAPDLPLNERGLRDRLLNDGRLGVTWLLTDTMIGFDLEDAITDGWQGISKMAWRATVESAEQHNDPGHFTAFVGYEWTSMPGGQNLHRNVIYRGAKVPELPYSSVNSEDPRDLWTALETQRSQGMDVFAIPHNGNVSNGLMYNNVMFDGKPITAAYATMRNEYEPISEIFQVKGSSETNPLLSNEDEFAGFEIYDTQLSQTQENSKAKGSYARDALRTGIEISHSEGFNPYRFGVIGASDGHNASSPVEENNYHGKLPILDGSAALRMGKANYFPADRMAGGTRWSAAGLAAVWAEENTRGSLFDAMKRKETYATSGPRIALRFFGGWNYPDDLLAKEEWIVLAEQNGVPMGRDLPAAEGGAPDFAIWAMRDPRSGNLDRIQIIKGWVDSEGASHEKIFNVAWSGQRQLDDSGNLRPVGNTVDPSTATYTNNIGEAQLSALWTDPEFDPEQEAFYYTRVIEIPTPRWTTFDALTLGMEPPEPVSLQERAVSSAIRYKPR